MTVPARYFPVYPGPLKMLPGLFQLGTDFGNAGRDAQFFQHDGEWSRYRRAKRDLWQGTRDAVCLEDSAAAQPIHRAVCTWMQATISAERQLQLPAEPDYLTLADHIQEDFVVVVAPPDCVDRVIAVAVCFPSGWYPERLLGQCFASIHAPVANFETVRAAAPKLVRAMISRGPFVRFVWTVCSDDRLDHHPARYQSAGYQGNCGYLRVERQVTVPFPQYSASLFLIRTYVYAFATLSQSQRRILAAAVGNMPAAIAEYKGLAEHIETIVAMLG